MIPTSTMTLSEFLEKHPDLYDGVKGWNFNPDTNIWEETTISQNTKDLLFEEFCDRYVNNDVKFMRLYRKKLNGTALRYANLRRIELTAFDPLVADYMERQEISEANGSHSSESEENGSKNINSEATLNGTKGGSEDNNNTNINDPQVIQNKTSTRTPDLTETTHTEGGTDEQRSEHSDDRAISKNAPMSAEYANATAGEIPDLQWRSLTAQQQSDHAGSGSTNGTSEEEQTRIQEGTETTTDKEWSTGVDTETNNGHREWSEEDGSNDVRESSEVSLGNRSESGSNSENKQVRSIQTGRGGLTPQEALKQAADYIKGSSASEWLKSQVKECFRTATYNPDEMWMY